LRLNGIEEPSTKKDFESYLWNEVDGCHQAQRNGSGSPSGVLMMRYQVESSPLRNPWRLECYAKIGIPYLLGFGAWKGCGGRRVRQKGNDEDRGNFGNIMKILT
jgi:hypothetical protein